MSRERTSRKSSAPAAAAPAAAARPFVPRAWAVVGMLVALTLIVQRHTLHSYFALDDFIMFQQAAGIRPWPGTLWRWLSGWAWFKAVVPLWGHAPFPYHAASLALHLVNTVLVYRLARRWDVMPAAAFPGAALFGISRLHFPALLAATSIRELLALTGTPAAPLLAGPRPRR